MSADASSPQIRLSARCAVRCNCHRARVRSTGLAKHVSVGATRSYSDMITAHRLRCPSLNVLRSYEHCLPCNSALLITAFPLFMALSHVWILPADALVANSKQPWHSSHLLGLLCEQLLNTLHVLLAAKKDGPPARGTCRISFCQTACSLSDRPTDTCAYTQIRAEQNANYNQYKDVVAQHCQAAASFEYR